MNIRPCEITGISNPASLFGCAGGVLQVVHLLDLAFLHVLLRIGLDQRDRLVTSNVNWPSAALMDNPI